MYHIHFTEYFSRWLENLKDLRVKAKIITRLERAASGNLGDHKTVGEGISEMRIHEGKGYRLYYTWRGNSLIVMLAGGSKATQSADIRKAQAMRMELNDEDFSL
ncbi:MAG: type II toxin-antitoxin system RelE/ParE family toxin [Cardiobacteriaceae bacterium]|nr:type II toxin-antitoxin system RelE/ParE family toxin [Cardiobacteriaceae bacterium]